jgi:uncharacterized protein
MKRIDDRIRYISLSTYRRDGREVATPVWFACDEQGALLVFSAPDAGKVRRLRNASRARVAPCDYHGKISGDSIAANAYLLNDADARRGAHRCLLRKYGWQMRLLDIVSTLGGRIGKRQFIRVEIAE